MSALVIGKTYRFKHRQKGIFTGRLISIEEGDVEDPEFYRVQVPTHEGSGNEHIANAKEHVGGKKQTPARTTKLLRPSHLIDAEEVI